MIDRIAIIGGSSVYVPEFLMSVVSRNIKLREVALIGRPGRKLETVTAFCKRLVKRSGYPLEIIGTSDVAAGVKNARYILYNVRVGGMQARVRDEKLPPKFGMIGHEALGAGGFANAMRTLPVVFEHAKILEDAAPDAQVINLANPMGMVVEAFTNYSKINVVGVTDLPNNHVKRIANYLGEDPKNLTVDYVGLNHLGWIQDVQSGGRSRMSQLLDILEKRPDEGLDYELIELFRMIPTSHTATYFRQAEILKRQRAAALFRSEILHEAEQQILKLYENEHLHDIPDLTRERNAQWYDQTVIPLILSMESDQPRNMILCLKNKGALRDLSDRCRVEVPAVISKEGVKAQNVGSAPRFLRGMYQAEKESERLTIEAARHKSYDYALQALAVNPFVSSVRNAQEYLARVIKEEKLELH